MLTMQFEMDHRTRDAVRDFLTFALPEAEIKYSPNGGVIKAVKDGQVLSSLSEVRLLGCSNAGFLMRLTTFCQVAREKLSISKEDQT